MELGQGALPDALRRLALSDRPLFGHCCLEGQAMLFPPRNVLDD
ncbi:hypothetical protein OOT46_08700 [Aquabacterium sp. A7-Y]|nr:hypothetical protein [Aquabacterium sp. A7-Y]MCW7537927.1 hypothetical protein [Aquabacterium sp. A7-Y]